jgi:hypothetical protein
MINPTQQLCVLGCLQALLGHIDFGDAHCWSFINDDLMRHVCKCMNTQPALYADALELVKLTVSKSSSLIGVTSSSRPHSTTSLSSTSSPKNVTATTTTGATPVTMHNFFARKELPGRTLEFDFDFGLFTATAASYEYEPAGLALRKHASVSSTQSAASGQHQQQQPPPMLNLLNLHVVGEHFNLLNQYTNIGHVMHQQSASSSGGWKRPALSKQRTRDRFYSLLSTFTTKPSSSHPSHHNNILMVPASSSSLLSFAGNVHKNIIIEEPSVQQQPATSTDTTTDNQQVNENNENKNP